MRKVVVGWLAVILLVGLTACGGDGKDTSRSVEEDELRRLAVRKHVECIEECEKAWAKIPRTKKFVYQGSGLDFSLENCKKKCREKYK